MHEIACILISIPLVNLNLFTKQVVENGPQRRPIRGIGINNFSYLHGFFACLLFWAGCEYLNMHHFARLQYWQIFGTF